MKILVFDNYDSFTYNLVHLVKKLGTAGVDVYRNDEIPLEQVAGYDKIILSPGPGVPEEAGLLLPLIKEYASTKSILGVCLGHQAIGEAFGGRLINLNDVYHGIAMPVKVAEEVNGEGQPAINHPSSVIFSSRFGLFDHLPSTFPVGRYHSWIVSEENFPDELEITARDEQDFIMALQHKTYDVQGVQFHPESVLTPDGEQILKNWIER